MFAPEDRAKTFYVGSLDFDPKHVGFKTEKFAGGFRFDTTIEGNSNSGHAGKHYTETKDKTGKFREFNDDQRWELIEYMKTLK